MIGFFCKMTSAAFKINKRNYEIDFAAPLNIAIPLHFNGIQPNAYGVEKATSKPCEAGELIGDTRHGGSCNFEQYKFIPHCNGTHTECVGHLTHERIAIHNCLKDAFIPATLISIAPENTFETGETYAVQLDKQDKLLTRKGIIKALENANQDFCDGLIVRTLPNDETKLSQTYLDDVPSFFSTEAMQFIVELGVKHLLVDTPSIDRIFDEGKLANHRTFWNIEPSAFQTNENSRINNTITELIFVPNEITDGSYLLNLQIAPFAADAAPSRPVLFKVF